MNSTIPYIQEILAFVIVAAAIFYAAYKVTKRFSSKSSGCEGCASDCSGCSIMDLKKQIEENKTRNSETYDSFHGVDSKKSDGEEAI